jgi:hypothetical protein
MQNSTTDFSRKNMGPVAATLSWMLNQGQSDFDLLILLNAVRERKT